MVEIKNILILLIAFQSNFVKLKSVNCDTYNTVTSGTNLTVGYLHFNTMNGFLIQDNAQLEIYEVLGSGVILYGDNGYDEDNHLTPIVKLSGKKEDFYGLTIGDNIHIIKNYTE